jgi:hypothetical protein
LLLQLHVVAVAPRRRYNLGQLAEGQPSTPFLLQAPIPGVANGLHRSYKGSVAELGLGASDVKRLKSVIN